SDPFGLSCDLFVLSRECHSAAVEVERAMLRGPHQPCTWLRRYARRRPLLERGPERVLRELLSCPDVADHPSQPGDEPGRLDAPDRFDRATRLRRYSDCSVTCPRTPRPRGPRTCHRRTARASATRAPRPSSAPAIANTRPR